MSVRAWRVRFPGVLVSVSVERSCRQRKGGSPADTLVKVGRDRAVPCLPSAAGAEPNLMKLQM